MLRALAPRPIFPHENPSNIAVDRNIRAKTAAAQFLGEIEGPRLNTRIPRSRKAKPNQFESGPSRPRLALIVRIRRQLWHLLSFFFERPPRHPATTPPATPRCGNVYAILVHVLQQQIDRRHTGEKEDEGDEDGEHGGGLGGGGV